MNIPARACLFLLVAMATPALPAQSGLVGVRAHRPEEYLKVVGIMHVAGRSYAAISEPYIQDSRRWVEVGGELAKCQVTEIGQDWVFLSDLRGRRQIRLPLGGPGKIEGYDAARWRKDWINSDANPMYFAPFPLPRKLSDRWSKLSQQDKSHLIAVYREFGWNLDVVSSPSKKPQFNWQNTYEAERKAALDKIRVDFEASLNSDQKAIYARINAAFSDPSLPAKIREQALADNAARETERAKLKATFSPRQRELYYAAIEPRAGMVVPLK